MKSVVVKHSVNIHGHKTSISLEAAFWTALKDIAQERRESLQHLINSIDAARQSANLSSVLRVFILEFYKAQSAPDRPPGSATADRRAARLTRLAERLKRAARQLWAGVLVPRADEVPSIIDRSATYNFRSRTSTSETTGIHQGAGQDVEIRQSLKQRKMLVPGDCLGDPVQEHSRPKARPFVVVD